MSGQVVLAHIPVAAGAGATGLGKPGYVVFSSQLAQWTTCRRFQQPLRNKSLGHESGLGNLVNSKGQSVHVKKSEGAGNDSLKVSFSFYSWALNWSKTGHA